MNGRLERVVFQISDFAIEQAVISTLATGGVCVRRRLRHQVEAGPVGPRAILAESGDAGVDRLGRTCASATYDRPSLFITPGR